MPCHTCQRLSYFFSQSSSEEFWSWSGYAAWILLSFSESFSILLLSLSLRSHRSLLPPEPWSLSQWNYNIKKKTLLSLYLLVSMILLATWNSTCWDRLAGGLKCNIYNYIYVLVYVHRHMTFIDLGWSPMTDICWMGWNYQQAPMWPAAPLAAQAAQDAQHFFLETPVAGYVWCSNDVWYYAGSVPCIIAYYHIIILLHFSEWIPQKQWVYLCNHWINIMYLRFQIVVVIVLVMCGHDMTWHARQGSKKKK